MVINLSARLILRLLTIWSYTYQAKMDDYASNWAIQMKAT